MSGNLRLIDSGSVDGYRELVPTTSGMGVPNRGFAEHRVAEFFLDGYSGARLYIDDEPVALSRAAGREVWSWRPRFFAGTVRAELIELGAKQMGDTYLLDVAPDPQKLGQAEFSKLIEDILRVDPTLLIGEEPATHFASGSWSTDDANLQYAYILQHGATLIEALRALAHRPRRRLEASRISVRPNQARKVDVRTVVTMARNGSLATMLSRDYDSGSATASDVRLDVAFSIESLDSAANRCIAALTHAVLRRAVTVHRKMNSQVAAEKESVMSTGLRDRWPRRRTFLDSMVAELQSVFIRDPLKSVRQREISASGLTAVAADPIYARIQRLAWKILRPGMPAAGGQSWTWMSPTWDIYETWCFIEVAATLSAIRPDLRWTQFGKTATKNTVLIEGLGNDERIRLHYQRTFSSSGGEEDRSEFSSVSKELRPDLVLTIEAGSIRRWIVLDAKYSQSRGAILEAMNSAHVYHDALRWFNAAPYRSILLVPSAAQDVGWLQAQDFKFKHGVGITLCAPSRAEEDQLSTELRELLTKLH